MAAGAGLALACAGCTSVPDRRPQGATADDGQTGNPPLPAASAGGREAREASFARHLLDRFGYGPRPGDVERLLSIGARRWLDAQLDPDTLARSALLDDTLARWPTLAQPHAPTLARFARLQAEFLGARTEESRRERARAELRELVRQVQTESRQARMLRALHGPNQLQEALVEFWFNHFNVFAGKETVRVTAGHFEHEAIRPHVLGRFRDLLGATARHPAMLNYLDNWQSVAAAGAPILPMRSMAPGRQRVPIARGPNENYARELLELHTLGVDGGYTQRDVGELARILTGWTFDRRATDGHSFRFVAARHDHGPKTLLGRPVQGEGQAQGEWALDVLARHPATARHLARKLARAFVADDPPASLIERLSHVFVRTDGDLREVVRALATSPEFAAPETRGAKFKTPYQYLVSAARALGSTSTDARALLVACARMGMPVHGCPTPDGWSDTRAAWASADGLRQRVEFAVAAAQRAANPQRIPETVLATLGPVAREAIASAPPGERLAIALASPDFMRR